MSSNQSKIIKSHRKRPTLALAHFNRAIVAASVSPYIRYSLQARPKPKISRPIVTVDAYTQTDPPPTLEEILNSLDFPSPSYSPVNSPVPPSPSLNPPYDPSRSPSPPPENPLPDFDHNYEFYSRPGDPSAPLSILQDSGEE